MTDSLIARMQALKPGPGQLGVYFLGQVGVALVGPDATLYIDPYLTDNDGAGGTEPRCFPPPLEPGAVTNADYVLISHVHVDHFDPLTLGPLAKSSPDAQFYGPHTCDFSLANIEASRVTRPVALEPFSLGSARITPLPSKHTEFEYSDKGFSYLGYLIEWNGVTLYHSGDTILWDGDDDGLPDDPRLKPGLIGLLKPFELDLAFLPINGRDYFRTRAGIVGNLDHREAARLADTLRVREVVPTHYDLIQGNITDPGLFVSYLYGLNPQRTFKMMRPGELYLYHHEDGLTPPESAEVDQARD